MSPETKLKHLKDYINWWVDLRVSEIKKVDDTFFFLETYGILLHKRKVLYGKYPPTFEEYLKQIK